LLGKFKKVTSNVQQTQIEFPLTQTAPLIRRKETKKFYPNKEINKRNLTQYQFAEADFSFEPGD
jgi:hypothetical protein